MLVFVTCRILLCAADGLHLGWSPREHASSSLRCGSGCSQCGSAAHVMESWECNHRTATKIDPASCLCAKPRACCGGGGGGGRREGGVEEEGRGVCLTPSGERKSFPGSHKSCKGCRQVMNAFFISGPQRGLLTFFSALPWLQIDRHLLLLPPTIPFPTELGLQLLHCHSRLGHPVASGHLTHSHYYARHSSQHCVKNQCEWNNCGRGGGGGDNIPAFI